MTTRLPIEIVGGGVAGLSLGLALLRSGIPVTLYEAGHYPRHRVCGEFISGLDPDTTRILAIEEFIADAWPHRSAAYHLRNERLPTFTLPTLAWGISRHTFDARLAAAFLAAGGNLSVETRLAGEETPPGRVFATGRSRSGPFWVGLKVHLFDYPLAADLEIHLGQGAYLGLSRTETGRINLCGIFSPQAVRARGLALITEYLRGAGLQALAKRVEAARFDPESLCRAAAPLGSRRCANSDRVQIGDACATIPPFTGNGLAMALQGAALALPVLRAYALREITWPETRRAIGQAQRKQFRRRLALARCLHPFFIKRRPQAVLAALVRRRLLPFNLLYAALR